MAFRPLLISVALLTCGLSAHAGNLRVQGQIVTEASSGNPPLDVSSSTRVDQFNADQLDGFNVGDFAVAGSGAEVHYKNVVGLPGGSIDQDCAVNSGCFPGDTAGFPVTIENAGSYRLEGSLDLSVTGVPEDATAISVKSSNVHLDLEGFAIRGTTTCSGTPVNSCDPQGTGDGVLVDTGYTNVRVTNGSVQGTGRYGVLCLSPCRVTGISAAENGQGGIRTDALDTVVANATARRNDIWGILLWAGGTARNSVGAGNGGTGIQINSPGGSVVDSRATDNGGAGFNLVESTVADSSAAGNAGSGFDLFAARAHDNIATSNSQSGFVCEDCLLSDNVAQNNGTFGINFNGTSNAWQGNQSLGNITANVDGSAVSLGSNACGSSLC